jgi:hypothetical protein
MKMKMNKKMMMKIQLLFLCMSTLTNLQAQVTIGASEAPAQGALLQLKDIPNASPGAMNATKGLLLPRVALVNDTVLAPMFPGATDADKREHAGLIVYNLTTNTSLKEGLMLWDGQTWGHIKYDEIIKDIVIAKRLYTNKTPIDANSTKIDNLEISLGSDVHGKNPKYYAYPKFKKRYTNNVKYSYQMAQYWESTDGTGHNGYSNDLSAATTVGASSFIGFADGNDMSPKERNEVWLVNDDKQIYHIQFFVLGPSDPTKNEVYAILVEKFEP